MSGSSLATIDIIIIVGFLLLVTLIGYLMSKAASKGLDDYFLGGNKIPWWILGISTATSNFDMAGTMIIVAVVFGLGYKGFLVEMRGGVGLSLAFLMIFLGKWLRRSRVMTSAEWMKIRFGVDKQGRAAHFISAIANITLSLGMIIYFSKGAGKFLTYFLPLDEFTCTSIMVSIGLFYTLMSGLYGVVFTDVVQMVILAFTAIYVTIKAFIIRPEVDLPEGLLNLNLSSIDPSGAIGQSLYQSNPGYWDPIFQFFGLCVFMWVFRTTLEGMGGVGGYTDQRFFAARSEREASLLTLESILISILRWTMVAGLVVLGYNLVGIGGESATIILKDAEQVLPVVLGKLLPTGVKGFVIAGLIAAAMSTFDSTLNAGAAYITKDLYHSYFNKDANQTQLIWASRWATVALCIAGVGLASVVPNINKIWGLITMGIGAGMFVPLFLRWYWPRFNGYGFATGTFAGIGSALIYNTGLELPLYYAFPLVIATAFIFAIFVTLATPRVEDTVLVRFWTQIDPWGAWGRIRALAKLDTEELLRRRKEKRNDMIALFFSISFQISVLICSMSFVFHDWNLFIISSIIVVIGSIGLYFFWFKNLKGAEQCALEDEKYKDNKALN